MNSISVTLTLKYRIDFAHEYQFSGKQLFNTKTNRKIKQVYCGGSIGYCIRGKFYSLTRLRGHLERIPKKEYCPF